MTKLDVWRESGANQARLLMSPRWESRFLEQSGVVDEEGRRAAGVENGEDEKGGTLAPQLAAEVSG